MIPNLDYCVRLQVEDLDRQLEALDTCLPSIINRAALENITACLLSLLNLQSCYSRRCCACLRVRLRRGCTAGVRDNRRPIIGACRLAPGPSLSPSSVTLPAYLLPLPTPGRPWLFTGHFPYFPFPVCSFGTVFLPLIRLLVCPDPYICIAAKYGSLLVT